VPVDPDATECRIVLRRAATIRGVVIDEDGKPVEKVSVAAKRDGKTVTSALAGADGAFSLDVPPGEAFEIMYVGRGRRANGEEELVGDPVPARSGAIGVELRLRRLARDRTLRVRIVFPDGTPAAGINVSCERRRADTGADGFVTLTGLPAKEVAVTALVRPDTPDLIGPAPVRLVPNGQEVTLSLRKSLTISGIVVMPDASGVTGVSVGARRDRMSYAADAAPDGTFVVRVPADDPGPWTVWASTSGRVIRGHVKDVPTGATGVRIELR
jgi:hypothetical protein